MFFHPLIQCLKPRFQFKTSAVSKKDTSPCHGSTISYPILCPLHDHQTRCFSWWISCEVLFFIKSMWHFAIQWLVFREPFPLWLIFISHILANRILSSHLVMTFTVRHGKIHLFLSSVNHLFLSIHPFLVGKPSISMGHLYHGYLTNNQVG